MNVAMSLDLDGFTSDITGGVVSVSVSHEHRLLKLARNLPWDAMGNLILPDLQNTKKGCWWMGRPLSVRIHLGIYVLQKMFDMTDRMAEHHVRDNAAFQIFCGNGVVKKWHVPDHTKIEEFRSRLTAETQRKLSNLIAQQAVDLGYGNPAELDIDSTVQDANIGYPTLVNLIIKIGILATTVAKGLNQLCHAGARHYCVGLTELKRIALYYFTLKRQDAAASLLHTVKQELWEKAYASILPILMNLHQLTSHVQSGKYWALRRAMEILRWRGAQLLENMHSYLFEGIKTKQIYSLHAYDVTCINKGKLNQKLQFGRVYQLGRIGGNFLIVDECTSVHMPDASSLPAMVVLHQELFGKNVLESIATDKGYYSWENEHLLMKEGVKDIYLPRPSRYLKAAPEKTSGLIRQLLHNRRAGIEPLIGHAKHGGQLRRSRMKSDETTKSAGYAAIFGFNLRQLTRHVAGEICPKDEKGAKNAVNDSQVDEKVTA